MIDKELVSNFSKIIGYIDVVLSFDGFGDIKDDYNFVKVTLLNWVKYYYENKDFNNITYDESLKIHDILQDVRDIKIYDKNLGMEAMITDDILIRYEVIVKSINEKRGK